MDMVESNPDLLAETVRKNSRGEQQPSERKPAETVAPAAGREDKVDLYKCARSMNLEELTSYLSQFSADELKRLLRKYRLGCTRLKSAQSIARHMAETLKVRTTDVFSQQ